MRRLTRWIAVIAVAVSSAQTTRDYTEEYRPQFHFSPLKNWTNDPNGLVYVDGEYHLFFQFNPFGNQWGHMSWGHAISKDLVHWSELPVALAEENGIMIFTGSTVIDEANTSGFCTDGKPCMVAIYTGHKQSLQTQNLAFSNDRGRTWMKYAKNPVLDLNMADFRDPNVFWSLTSKRWIMAVVLPNEHKVLIYASPDLKAWERVSEFGPAGATGGQWECPDLFEAPIKGTSEKRWVLKVGLNPGGLQGGSGEQYFVGQFDGTRFTNENPVSTTLWTDYGKDCYCALTFNHLPPGRDPVILGWMSNWQYAGKVPTNSWRGQMTVPREVALGRFPEGLRLVQQPVGTLASQRRERVPEAATAGRTFDLTARIETGTAQQFGWRLSSPGGAYTLIGYDLAKGELFIDRMHSGQTGFSEQFPARTGAKLSVGKTLQMRVLVDRSSVELFADSGRVTMTNLFFPPEGDITVRFYARGGEANASKAMWRMGSIWQSPGMLP